MHELSPSTASMTAGELRHVLKLARAIAPFKQGTERLVLARFIYESEQLLGSEPSRQCTNDCM
jgi:hypothetical protein